MIVTRILGGLGNQLFQYAAARALAISQNVEVKLDVIGFAEYRLRDFELNAFQAEFSLATPAEIARLKAQTPLQRLAQRFRPAYAKRFYKEPHFHFDPTFEKLRAPVYVQGYFQSERYFAGITDIVRKEFRFRHRFAPPVEAMAAKLSTENSVSLHLRRGDYQNAEALEVHGVLPVSYYTAAIETLQQRLGPLRLYVFTDEPTMATNLFNDYSVEIVSGRLTKTAFEDFYLMQHCRHNVIANSSFSWWAAWLNSHAEKIIIAPKNWFAKGPATHDLLPEQWLRL